MDTKVRFLFGDDPSAWPDPDDEDDVREALVAEFGNEGLHGRMITATMQVVANHVLGDDLPEVWAAVERSLAAGRPRESVMSQIVYSLLDLFRRTVESGGDVDLAEYRRRLATLPLPATPDIIERFRIEVQHEAVPGDALIQRVVDHFDGHDVDMLDELVTRALDLAMDRGWLAYVMDDHVVDPDELVADAVLTHRLTAEELEIGLLAADFDLPNLTRGQELTFAGMPLAVVGITRDERRVGGPHGWLDGYADGEVIAVRVDRSGEVHVERVEVRDDPARTQLVTEVIAELHDQLGLPTRSGDLLLEVAARDSAAVAAAGTPWSAIAAGMGWQVRGWGAGPGDEAWDAERRHRQLHRLGERLGFERSLVAWKALDLDSPDDALAALADALDDPLVALHLAAELTGEPDLDRHERDADFDRPAPPDGTAAWVDRLLAVATDRVAQANARLVAAILAERTGAPEVAEAHLAMAHDADPQNPDVTDRLAWYHADRGRAADAVRLWRRLDADDGAGEDLEVAQGYTRAAGPVPGRNQPCWCGSGRKYKQCHLGEPPQFPLPERVPWLMRKAAAYVQRRGELANDLLLDLGWVLADGDPERLADTLLSPYPLDLTLVEGGWFAEFVRDRGVLLPEDEAALAASWIPIERSVFEVVAVEPGIEMAVRNVRTGDLTIVTDRTLSRRAVPHIVLCARVVPDGDGHVFAGMVFPVTTATDPALLALLDERDPHALAEWCAGLFRPPEMRNRENEVLIDGRIITTVPDGVDVVAALDDRFERQDDARPTVWHDLWNINERERIVRGRIELEQDRVVLTANSHERLDRLAAVILDALPGAETVEDCRDDATPTSMTQMARAATAASPELSDQERDALLADYADAFERDWCDEAVPALGGLTPREAAADPTRRDQVRQLLASYDARPGGLIRTDRLRARLGL